MYAGTEKSDFREVNDPVWRHDGRQGREGKGIAGIPPKPPEDIGWQTEKGRAGLRRIAT